MVNLSTVVLQMLIILAVALILQQYDGVRGILIEKSEIKKLPKMFAICIPLLIVRQTCLLDRHTCYAGICIKYHIKGKLKCLEFCVLQFCVLVPWLVAPATECLYRSVVCCLFCQTVCDTEIKVKTTRTHCLKKHATSVLFLVRLNFSTEHFSVLHFVAQRFAVETELKFNHSYSPVVQSCLRSYVGETLST